MIVKIKNYHGYKGNNSMKYIKIFFIFFTVMNSFVFCADQSLVADKAQQDEASQTEVSTKDNELLNWNNHLNTLKEHWNSSTNIPDQEWIENAISIAIDTLRINKELAQELKDSFFNAIKQHNAEFTKETTSLITKFDNAVDKELATSETVVEKKEEPVATTPQTTEKVPTPPEPQPEEVPAPEAAPAPIETITQPIEKASEPELPKETKKEEEKKEDFLKEWNNCLKNIQKKSDNIYALTNQAAELAQKLQDPQQTSKPMKVTELTQAFERAIILRRDSSSEDKNEILDYFTRMLGISIPTKPIARYQPTKTELDIISQREDIEAKQRMAQEESDKKIKLIEKDTMLKQAAITQAAERQFLTQSQWQKSQISSMEALQRASAETLRQLQADAEQLKLELKKAVTEQRVAAEKSLFTRAKETVTGFIWGSGETQSPEESIEQKKEKLEQLTKQISQEEAKLSEQVQRKSKQFKKIAEIKERIARDLTDIALKRSEELKKEKEEIAQLKANTAQVEANNKFRQQVLLWREFLTHLEHNINATKEDNNKATQEAIAKAKHLLMLIPQFAPQAHIINKSNGLKQSFINALLIQQKNQEKPLNIFDNQDRFDKEINIFLEQLQKGQLAFQLTQ